MGREKKWKEKKCRNGMNGWRREGKKREKLKSWSKGNRERRDAWKEWRRRKKGEMG